MCIRWSYPFITYFWKPARVVIIIIILVCVTAKNLVASLMEVDQDQRLTAQEAIAHEW